MTDDEVKIRASIMVNLGCDEAQAEFVMTLITKCWHLEPGQLPQFLAYASVPHLGISRTGAAIGLYYLERLSHTVAGRMLLIEAGKHAAAIAAAIERQDTAVGN